jgi:RNA polymerase sigma-70 factor (sigma-E family)
MKLMPEIDLRVVFEDHYAPLVRFCLLVTGNHDAAEDLAQEAFVRVIGRSHGRPIEDVGAYLRKVALNLWRNRLRRLLLERRAGRQSTTQSLQASDHAERHDVVWRAIQQLPDRQRACLVLRYYEDMSVREAAATLGTSEGSIKSNTSKALARLRKELPDGS